MKNRKLIRKILLLIFVVAVLLCTVCVCVGYSQYKNYIYKSYNTTAYQVAEIFQKMITEDELHYYSDLAKEYRRGNIEKDTLEKITNNKKYKEVLKNMNLIREKMELNDIFYVYVDKETLYEYNTYVESGEEWLPLIYIFDSYYDKAKAYTFGDQGGINPNYIKETIKIIETGKRSKSYFISESQYGYNTSAIIPIIHNGETIGIIGVEIPILNIEEVLNTFVKKNIIAFVFVTAIILGINIWYLYYYLVKPIEIILGETKAFVREDNKISEKLGKIKTGDEIQLLGETILQMEIDINHYIDHLVKITEEKEKMGEQLDMVSDMAYTDPLTGAKSKASYQKEVSRLEQQIKEGIADFGIVMLDLNYLKQINDTYGHKAGDIYIKNAARLIGTVFKDSPIFRIGGDEFVVFLFEDDLKQRNHLMELFFQEMEKRQKEAGIPEEKVQIAAGMTEYKREIDRNFQDVFERADHLMYRNKKILKEKIKDIRNGCI